MTPSLEGLPTKVKEAPFPHEVRLAPLETKPVFQCLKDKIGHNGIDGKLKIIFNIYLGIEYLNSDFRYFHGL